MAAYEKLVEIETRLKETHPQTKPELGVGYFGSAYIRLKTPDGKEARIHVSGKGKFMSNRIDAGCRDLDTAVKVALIDAVQNNPYCDVADRPMPQA